MRFINKEMEISEKNGFNLLNCDSGINSIVFEKEGYIYKINKRNSLQRAESDYKKLKEICADFPDRVVESSFFECMYGGEKHICIKQKKIVAQTIKQFGKNKLIEFLKNNKEDALFLKKLVDEFFTCIENKKLYPDIVGSPSDQSIFNSINILVENGKGLVLCDVGLSPHEDTLKKYGIDFYSSGNVAHYVKRINEARRILLEM